MSAHALQRDLLMPRPPGGTAPGIGLSLLVHAGLIVAIAFGVSWRSRVPQALQAELWAAVPQAAAPRAVEPEVQPAPAPPPVPREMPKPKPAPAPPPPAPLPDAQIAIEKARAEKARVEKLRKEQEAAEREREAARQKKLAAEQAEKAEKERARQQVEAQKKLQQAIDERAAKVREAERAKQLQRIQGLAGASGEAGATGSALKSAGPSASYAGRIVARVRPNIVFADQVAGNPSAEVEVRAAPDGTILGRKLVKGSGVTAYDNAVLRAIDKTEVLPRDIDGRVPPTLTLVFTLRE